MEARHAICCARSSARMTGATTQREGETMIKPTLVLLGALFLAGGAALAKLPAPTAEEQAAKAATKAKQEEQLKKEKADLERAQDRVVQHYKKSKGSSASASSGSGQQTT